VLGECDEFDARTLHTSFRRLSPAFSLQNLRYALSAADYGSFRRAAEALLLRQSTLSRCVRQLEESIGMADFNGDLGPVDLGERVARASGRSAIMSGALAMSLA
jgi:Bacterial regulatory helix-turn-helix protein, lysR family